VTGAEYCPTCNTVLDPAAHTCSNCGRRVVLAAERASLAEFQRLYQADFVTRLTGWAIDWALYIITALMSRSVLGGAAIFVPLVAPVAFNSLGASPGKWTLGMRIIDERGSRPGLARGLVRSVVAYFSWMIFWLGYLWAAWEPRGRTWHDLAAGTVVIRTEVVDRIGPRPDGYADPW